MVHACRKWCQKWKPLIFVSIQKNWVLPRKCVLRANTFLFSFVIFTKVVRRYLIYLYQKKIFFKLIQKNHSIPIFYRPRRVNWYQDHQKRLVLSTVIKILRFFLITLVYWNENWFLKNFFSILVDQVTTNNFRKYHKRK